MITVDLSHDSEVYITVITENHAGIVRAFQSTSPVKVDHTPPDVDEVVVSVEVVEVNATGSPELRENVTVTWSATDDTSGINYCTCAIGTAYTNKLCYLLHCVLSAIFILYYYMCLHLNGIRVLICLSSGSFPFLDDVTSTWVSDSTNRCDAPGLNLTHGMTVFVTVKCVNNVELASTVSSSPVHISLDKPYINAAVLDIDPITVNSQNDFFAGSASTVEVQSNQSCLQFHWDGFEDVSPITGYGYEILDSYNNSLTGWTDASYRTMVTKCGLPLSTGQLAVTDVRAVNSGDHWSDTISKSIRISATSPPLTGLKNIIIWILSMHNVFNTPLLLSCMLYSYSNYCTCYNTSTGNLRVTTDILVIK